MYTLDQPVAKEGLWAAYVGSEHSLARLDAVDASSALQLPGVVAYITAADIPEAGVNSCMGQEPVFSEGLVEYLGQPIGLVVAEDRAAAERGAQLVKVSKGEVCCVSISGGTGGSGARAGGFWQAGLIGDWVGSRDSGAGAERLGGGWKGGCYGRGEIGWGRGGGGVLDKRRRRFVRDMVLLPQVGW